MAATGEWAGVPFVLTSPYGTLNLNDTSGDRYLLIPSGCDMGAALRVTKDNVPQGNGSILHRRFEEGYVCNLQMMLWKDDAVACGADLVSMLDDLNLHVRGLLNAGDNQGRLAWLPSGSGSYRMIDDIRLLERLVVAAPDDGGGTVVTFAVDSAYPYAQDLTQQSTALNATLNNTGTVAYWPVVQVFGATSAFTLTNVTTGKLVQYAGTAIPGGGQYVEIDMFRNTMYLNGNGANLISGLNMLNSDFFALEPGNNALTITGATATVLWAPAYT